MVPEVVHENKLEKVLCVRNYQQPRQLAQLTCCNETLCYTSNYKYLGILFNEHLHDKPCVDALTGAAARTFGRIVNPFKQLKTMGIISYQSLYESYVLSILNFGSTVWGFGEQSAPQVLCNRIKGYYLGVHVFTPVAAMSLEFDWLNIKYSRWPKKCKASKQD